MVENSSSGADADEWSRRRLRRARVQLTGTVTGINESSIYAATNVFPTDAQIDVPKESAVCLRKCQVVGFAGTVENVSDGETSPPMAHT
jgi:hypothetical protein